MRALEDGSGLAGTDEASEPQSHPQTERTPPPVTWERLCSTVSDPNLSAPGRGKGQEPTAQGRPIHTVLRRERAASQDADLAKSRSNPTETKWPTHKELCARESYVGSRARSPLRGYTPSLLEQRKRHAVRTHNQHIKNYPEPLSDELFLQTGSQQSFRLYSHSPTLCPQIPTSFF